jgi:phospholipase C
MQLNAARLTPMQQLVVLMLENRWFDHMLGYLRLKGGREDVDGLRASMSNQPAGKSYQRMEESRYGLVQRRSDFGIDPGVAS